MNTPSSRRVYATSVSTGVTAILFLAAVVLFVVFGGSDTTPRARAFGDPFAGVTGPEAAATPPVVEGVRVRTEPGPEPAASAHARPVAAPAPAAPAPDGWQRPAAAREHSTVGAANALHTARWLAAEKRWADALRSYDRLIAARPADATLPVERARVLAWSGDNLGAAAALAPLVSAAEGTSPLRVEQARYLWWGGEPLAADSALSVLLRAHPADAAADSLRRAIRSSVVPPTALAAQWLRESSGPAEHLRLARAYARDGATAAAVPHFRAALAGLPVSDSLALEVAGAALAADSLALAADALERVVALHPADPDARLRLARVYAWDGRVEPARRMYEGLLASRPVALFELAQLEAWHGSQPRAETLLTRFLTENPGSAPALKLLGDLARWRGDWQAASRLYADAAAADPAAEGLREAIDEANRLRLASAPAGPGEPRWLADAQGFADSDGFRWLSSRMAHRRADARHALGLTVHQDRWDGVGPGGAAAPGTGYGVEVTAERALAGAWSARGSLGARSHHGGVEYLTYAAEVQHAPRDATTVRVLFAHQPAGQRAATTAALQAETVSDLLQLTASRSLGRWHLWSQVDADHLASSLGATTRTAATVALNRDLGRGWSALATVGALTTDGDAPVLPGWGPLFWAPAAYVAPSAGIAYRADLGGVHLGARFAPAYAWIREREGGPRRFAADHAAVLNGGVQASYLRGPWQVDASADWNGALDDGYRASGIRLRAHYAPRVQP